MNLTVETRGWTVLSKHFTWQLLTFCYPGVMYYAVGECYVDDMTFAKGFLEVTPDNV